MYYNLSCKDAEVVMSLIKCPECKKKVSDMAKVCINCGYQLANKDNSFNNFLDNNIKQTAKQSKKK